MRYLIEAAVCVVFGTLLGLAFAGAFWLAESYTHSRPNVSHKPAQSYCLDKLASAINGRMMQNPCNLVFDERRT